jgi:anti-sigma B factor antagonist
MEVVRMFIPQPTSFIVLKPQGAINHQTADAFQTEALAAIAQVPGSTRLDVDLVVDMTQVDALDSHGLMALVFALNAAQSHGRSLKLWGVSPTVRIILELSGLDQVIDILGEETRIADGTNTSPPPLAA